MKRITLSSIIALSMIASAQGQPTDFWYSHWNGPGNHQDSVSAIAHGPDGSVSVAGLSRAADGIADFATARFAADGKLLWSAVYGNLPGAADDARGIGVDAAGNTYTLGVSYNGNFNQGGSDYDYVLIKYDPSGTQVWLRRFNGPGNWGDQPQDMVVDAEGNCYIAGGVFYQPGPTGGYATDFHVLKYTPTGDIAWQYHTNSASMRGGIANAIALDDAGNVYATGYVIEPGANQDFLTVKLTNTGNLVYREQHSTSSVLNSGDDEGLVIIADSAGNAYVAGYWRTDPVLGEPDRHLDTLTIKYSPSGQMLWTRSTTREREDAATSIAVDDVGNVYVGGAWLGATETDAWIECYSPSGDMRWDFAHDEVGTFDENWIVELRMGQDGLLYAAADNERPTGYDPTLFKFSPDGTLLHQESFDAGTTSDSCFDMDLDELGNVYFGGNSYFGTAGSDFMVMKVLVEQATTGDVNSDGVVNVADLLAVIGTWGPCAAPPQPCPADLNGDGSVSVADLLTVIANWG